MSTPVTFRADPAPASKSKLDWLKLPIADLPKDIQDLAIIAIRAELDAMAALRRVQAALDDKVNAPPGQRLVVTLGRSVSENTDCVLYAWAKAGAGSTRVVSFNQFIKG